VAPNIAGVLSGIPLKAKVTRHTDSVVTLGLVRQGNWIRRPIVFMPSLLRRPVIPNFERFSAAALRAPAEAGVAAEVRGVGRSRRWVGWLWRIRSLYSPRVLSYSSDFIVSSP
jgi:hypothetical protein